MAAAKIIHRIAGTGQTVGATSVTLATFTLPNDAVIVAEGYACGRTSVGNSAGFKVSASAKRVASAAATAIGAVAGLLGVVDAALATATVTISATGNDVILQATGTIGQTIDWFGELQVWVN